MCFASYILLAVVQWVGRRSHEFPVDHADVKKGIRPQILQRHISIQSVDPHWDSQRPQTVASEANTGAEQEFGNIKVTHKASHRIETIKKHFLFLSVAKHDRENTQAMLESAQLQVQLGEHKKAAEVLDWILDSKTANSDSSLYMSVTKELAKVCAWKK